VLLQSTDVAAQVLQQIGRYRVTAKLGSGGVGIAIARTTTSCAVTWRSSCCTAGQTIRAAIHIKENPRYDRLRADPRYLDL